MVSCFSAGSYWPFSLPLSAEKDHENHLASGCQAGSLGLIWPTFFFFNLTLAICLFAFNLHSLSILKLEDSH